MATFKYNGMELEEFTSDKPVFFDTNQEAIVWNDYVNKDRVIVLSYDPRSKYPVRSNNDRIWKHFAFIPEKTAPRMATMIKPRKLKGILLKIKEELHKAESKHPKFCDKMTNCVSADFMKKSELLYNKFNSKPPYSAESILEEKVREALSAYLEGDRIHALEELAQCGAVVIRMMDFVSKEIENENADKV